MQGHTVAVNVQCAEYEGPSRIRDTIKTPWLDVSAIISDDGWVSMAIVNVHENKNFEIRLGEVGFVDVQVFRVTGPKCWSCECRRSGGSWNTRKSVEWKGIILLLKTFVDTS
jgi:hypothetical protein